MRNKHKKWSFYFGACAFAAACAACSEPQTSESGPSELGKESTSITSSMIRQTDAQGRHLPFLTTFKDRWSDRNDGSNYEPCTALSVAQISALGIDPQSVEDAAVANYQTVRGCQWRLQGSPTFIVGQNVSNGPDLFEFKKKNSSIISWMDDLTINGRTTAVGTRNGQASCISSVQSGAAIVTTSVSMLGAPPSETCAKAIAFTKATIDKMPP
ncbi:DUF3558 family protein [Gordonia sp. i37]|uniref:DUF3558 family protein n=1 Tax=Gordonia sp. i37 TaxID=1961707 RepID=UPI0009AC87B9|nr:DUF3558 family protein [Gordonia sp. i37]OPX16611.1 hypothetical protein B1964_03855 [Gordonia sp. i37]